MIKTQKKMFSHFQIYSDDKHFLQYKIVLYLCIKQDMNKAFLRDKKLIMQSFYFPNSVNMFENKINVNLRRFYINIV